MFDENRLRNHRADTARPPESGKRNDNMHKKDDETTHFSIVSRNSKRKGLWLGLARIAIRQGLVRPQNDGSRRCSSSGVLCHL